MITTEDVTYKGFFLKQYTEKSTSEKVMTFSSIGSDNTCFWGSMISKSAPEPATDNNPRLPADPPEEENQDGDENENPDVDSNRNAGNPDINISDVNNNGLGKTDNINAGTVAGIDINRGNNVNSPTIQTIFGRSMIISLKSKKKKQADH